MQAEEGNDHIGDFYHCYDEIPNKKKLKGGWGFFWLTVQRETVHHGEEIMVYCHRSIISQL